MPPMMSTPMNTRSLKHALVALQDRRAALVAATRLGQRLGDQEDRADQHHRAVDREHHEDPPPRHDRQQRGSDQRREHRRDTRDEREAREHHDEAPAAEQVADDRHGDDAAGGGAHPHAHAGDHEQFERRGEGGRDAGDDVQRGDGQQRNAPADLVAERPDDQLAQREADHRAGQSELDRPPRSSGSRSRAPGRRAGTGRS